MWSISSCSVVDNLPAWHIPCLSAAPGLRPERKTMSCTIIAIVVSLSSYFVSQCPKLYFNPKVLPSLGSPAECRWKGRLLSTQDTCMYSWWPTQLSWNTNDENFVPKVLNVSLCCECVTRHNSCHLIDLFLRQKLAFCARVSLYNMKSGIDIFESAALANVMKLFGFPFILHGWYQFRPWSVWLKFYD